jgi:hypothetical protein
MRSQVAGVIGFHALALTALLHAQRAEAVTLVRDGTPQATIVVEAGALTPKKDDAQAQKISVAARDLQDYIRKMSGATLPIVGDTQAATGATILVGRSRLTTARDAAIPHGLTVERREEGFLIETDANTLLLAGNDQGPYHGTEYATYDFLERLGIRWYMPGEFGEIVPSRRTIEVNNLSVREKPDFIMRNWWCHMTPEIEQQEHRWKIRNKMNPDTMFEIPGDGSVRGFVAPADMEKTHPEYFAKGPDGAVNTAMPNLTNPKAVEIAADKVKEVFRQHPDQNSIGFAPDDGIPRDFTPETRKLNLNFTEVGGREGVDNEVSASEEWFHFINAVAAEVKKEFPDRIISTNGYANRDIAPQGMKLDPNLCVMFAAIWADTLHSFDDPKSWQAQRQGQMIQRWAQMCPRVWIYGYTESMLVSSLTPVPLTRKLAHDIPQLKKWGVIGFFDESRNIWGESGITTKYIRARLEWDTNTNVNATLKEYFTNWYGAAARPSQAFWDDIEDAIQSSPMLGHEDRILPYVYTPRLLAKLHADVTMAEALAHTERERTHVRIDRLIYEHLKAYMAMTNAEFAGNYGAAAQAAENMQTIRKQLYNISPFLFWYDENGYHSNSGYWSVGQRLDYYKKYAALTNGEKGNLVTVLPEEASFSTDQYNEGVFAGWYEPQWDTSQWRRISTTTPFYAQGYRNSNGYPYIGYVWYRVNVNVPALPKGRRVMLFAPAIETEAWGWVNGQFVGHRPYLESYVRPNEMLFDVTDALVPGRTNTIVLRLNTGLSYDIASGGLVSRLVLFSPKSESVMK